MGENGEERGRAGKLQVSRISVDVRRRVGFVARRMLFERNTSDGVEDTIPRERCFVSFDLFLALLSFHFVADGCLTLGFFSLLCILVLTETFAKKSSKYERNVFVPNACGSLPWGRTLRDR